MVASKIVTATVIAASLVALAQADADPLMDRVLESTDPIGLHYYELETRWVQEKKTNCAHDVALVALTLTKLYSEDHFG